MNNPSGIFVSANLRLEILIEGKGLGFTLSPEEARSLAGSLIRRADTIEAAERAADEASTAAGADFARKAGIRLD